METHPKLLFDMVKNENKASGIFGVFPKIFSSCKGYDNLGEHK